MKHLLALLFIQNASATTLEFVNHTGRPARINRLHNKCGVDIVTEDKPVFLRNGGKYIIETTNVLHTYEVCDNGLCSSSAIGIKDAERYILEITMVNGMIDLTSTPDHWKGGNMECSEEVGP